MAGANAPKSHDSGYTKQTLAGCFCVVAEVVRLPSAGDGRGERPEVSRLRLHVTQHGRNEVVSERRLYKMRAGRGELGVCACPASAHFPTVCTIQSPISFRAVGAIVSSFLTYSDGKPVSLVWSR
jgi:hypothetical protein